MKLDADEIFNEIGEENAISFINNISKYYIDEFPYFGYSYDIDGYGRLSYDTKKKFYELSKNVSGNIVKDFTLKEFFKMCRVCYMSAPKKTFIEGISDYYLYAYENKLELADDYRILSVIKESGMDNINLTRALFMEDNLKEFNELQIKETEFGLKRNEDGSFMFDMCIWNLRSLTRGILMYIGLRENGYNFTVNSEAALKNYEKYSFEQ